MQLFDLNIETVLEHWGIEHGIREIIANALDESRLTGTAPISITKDEQGNWHIRDFGRGIRIDHFTLNENLEKIGADGVIGKFGVGLKDALAALDRHHARVCIRSRHGIFRLTRAAKHNFSGITTLHICREETDEQVCGTDVVFSCVPDSAIEKAKTMFLCFQEHRILDSTPFGQIIEATGSGTKVFLNGVCVNAEPGFLFSYNVTSLTESMRKALNRERVNVGRSVYADRLRQILTSSDAKHVLNALAAAYARKDEGELPEELRWIDVAHKALNELARTRRVVAVSHTEIKERPELVEDIKRDGCEIVLLTGREKERADEQAEQGKAPFNTLRTWIQSVNDSFQYQFVAENEFTDSERKVWGERSRILSLLGLNSTHIPRVLVSETIRASEDGTDGAWDSELNAIVVKRTQLQSLQAFAGTMLHELAHAVTGAMDCTRAFEVVLTDYLGKLAGSALSGTTVSAMPDSLPDEEMRAAPGRQPFLENSIEFLPVESSNVAAVGYDDERQRLYVKFRSGSRYYYEAVPAPVYRTLLNAASKGRCLNREIIGRYKGAQF